MGDTEQTQTVFQLFLTTFQREPKDNTLNDCPVESVCGEDCARAIYAGKALILCTDPAVHEDILKAIDHSVSIFWRG
jgi:hypothetical protein